MATLSELSRPFDLPPAVCPANGPLPAPGTPPKAERIVVSALGAFPAQRNDLDGAAALDYMRAYWSKELDSVLPDQPDLIVLPECCDRFAPMSMERRIAWYDYRGSQMSDFFRAAARQNRCHIAYSAVLRGADGLFRNTVQMIDRQGNLLGEYHKNYPTPGEMRQGQIRCGRELPVFTTDFGRVACMICFDIEFEPMLQRMKEANPDLIIYSTNGHGGLLRGYWSYYCQAHMVAAFPWESSVVNPVGMTLARSTNYLRNLTCAVNLDCQVVFLPFEKMQQMKKKYGRGVTVTDPGFLGTQLVTSELPDISALQMIREFDIERWDEYYARAMHDRNLPEHLEPQ